MVKVTYIEHGGKQHVLDLQPGVTVMQGAVSHDVRGILADCAGSCSCATCHVYVDPDWIDRVGEKSQPEELLIEEVCDPQPNSRLSCQILVTEDLDGLVVRLPEKQI